MEDGAKPRDLEGLALITADDLADAAQKAVAAAGSKSQKPSSK